MLNQKINLLMLKKLSSQLLHLLWKSSRFDSLLKVRSASSIKISNPHPVSRFSLISKAEISPSSERPLVCVLSNRVCRDAVMAIVEKLSPQRELNKSNSAVPLRPSIRIISFVSSNLSTASQSRFARTSSPNSARS